MHQTWNRQLDVVVLQKKTRVPEQTSNDAARHMEPTGNPSEVVKTTTAQLAYDAKSINGSFRGGYASRVIRTPTTGVRRPSVPHFALPFEQQYPHNETAL